ncbi:MAG: hypothetical protein IJK86_04195 [Lachnospiraceae bacterium]|nr:hypothetical protein [Lachnospiraceae bacterium]
MRKIKSIIALLLVTVLLLSGCGASNKSKYGSVVAATYGSERTVYLDEANFWLRAGQLSYSYIINIYKQLYGVTEDTFWASESGRRTQTYGESLKEDVMAEFRQMFILLDHAGEYDTALTDEDLSRIDKAVTDMKASYGSYLFTESIIGPYSDEQLKESLKLRSQAIKVWHGVREQATTNVTDEECKSFTLQYFRMDDSAATKDGETDVKGKAIADLLEAALNSGKTFDELSKTHSSLYTSKESFRRNDTEQTSQLFTVGKDMLEGQVRQFTDSSSGKDIYYVVKCISADDADAALKAREELESEQKEAHFNEVFAEWQKAAKDFSVKSAFMQLPLPGDK